MATLLGARDLTGRSYPFKSDLFPNGGTSVSFHGGSHHQDDPSQIHGARGPQPLPRVHARVPRRQKLREEPDGDGTLLNHSLVLYGTNMGNSNQHQHYDVPHILVGGASGQLKGNRHIAYERKTVPTGNLLLSVLQPLRHPSGHAGRQHRPSGEVRMTRRAFACGLTLRRRRYGLHPRCRQERRRGRRREGRQTSRFVALIAAKADINAPQVDGATALHWAIFRDDEDLALNLLVRSGANVKAANR